MHLLIIATVVFVMILLNSLIGGRSTENRRKTKPPYFKKDRLLNAKEQVVFQRLRDALPSHHVMTQVRLADIIEVKAPGNERQRWQNSINQRSVDFVVCDKAFKVLACIELDGKSHEQEDRKYADAKKNEALHAADIHIVRIKPDNIPSSDKLRKLLMLA